ncbi:MAG: hypothetical protein ING61_16175 [Rhodocyclaceae bacterium]|nr:hypothetical protein [Rhodocyclaceae bacterium]
MPRSILDMTADEPMERLYAGSVIKKPSLLDTGPGGTPENVGDLPTPTNSQSPIAMPKPNPTVVGPDTNIYPVDPNARRVEGEPVVGAAMSVGGGSNSAAAALPVSNASFNSGSAVSGINTPDTQGPQVPASTSMQRDSTGNATRDASGNTLGSSYESPESILRMAQGRLGQKNAANLSTNPNRELNYGVQGASLETAADSGSISNEGAVPQSPIDSLGQINLDENRAIEVMQIANQKSGQQPKPFQEGPGAGGNTDPAAYARDRNLQFDDNDVSNGVINLRKRYERLGLANRPGYGMDINGNAAPLAQIDLPLWDPNSGQDYTWAEGARPTPYVGTGSGAPPRTGNTTTPSNTTTPAMDFRGRTIIGTGGVQRQVREDGAILDAQGNPQGDGQGNLLNITADGTIMAGDKPWGYIQANGQARQGLRPAAGSPDSAQGTGMNFRGRTIIGTAGVPRQVDQNGRILSAAGGGYQLAEDGSELIVGEDGKITAGGKQWGYLDAQGKATKSSTGAGGTPNNGGQGNSIAAQAGLISPEMLVENRIANLMNSGNPLLEQALTRAKQIANERGTLNSSMAAQAGTEAMLSTAREIASQDANTLKDAALTEYQARIQQIMQDKSLSSAERENALQRAFQQSEGALNRTADVDAREFQARIQQIMQDKSLSSAERENALQREFQRSEGAAQRLFQGDMTREGWRLDSEKDTLNYQRNIANFERQIAATKDEGDRNFFRTMQQNYNQSILTLQTDPNMTPEQRSAQIAAMNSIFAGFTYNGAFLNMVKPAGSTTTGAGENTGTSGGGSGGGSGGTDSDQK